MKKLAIGALAFGLTLRAVCAFAETKAPKPVVCASYSIATTADGAKLGVCAPTKEGGKPRYLRSFQEVKLDGALYLVGVQ